MTILVTWLWQGIVLAAVTTASLRWATRLNAATRHVIYWVALTAVLLLPGVSWLTTWRRLHPPSSVPVGPPPHSTVLSPQSKSLCRIGPWPLSLVPGWACSSSV